MMLFQIIYRLKRKRVSVFYINLINSHIKRLCLLKSEALNTDPCLLDQIYDLIGLMIGQAYNLSL